MQAIADPWTGMGTFTKPWLSPAEVSMTALRQQKAGSKRKVCVRGAVLDDRTPDRTVHSRVKKEAERLERRLSGQEHILFFTRS